MRVPEWVRQVRALSVQTPRALSVQAPRVLSVQGRRELPVQLLPVAGTADLFPRRESPVALRVQVQAAQEETDRDHLEVRDPTHPKKVWARCARAPAAPVKGVA